MNAQANAELPIAWSAKLQENLSDLIELGPRPAARFPAAAASPSYPLNEADRPESQTVPQETSECRAWI